MWGLARQNRLLGLWLSRLCSPPQLLYILGCCTVSSCPVLSPSTMLFLSLGLQTMDSTHRNCETKEISPHLSSACWVICCSDKKMTNEDIRWETHSFWRVTKNLQWSCLLPSFQNHSSFWYCAKFWMYVSQNFILGDSLPWASELSFWVCQEYKVLTVCY